MGGRVVLLLLALVTTALLTRLLGPSGFGHYRAAVAYLALVISLADLGLASLFVREISRQGADQARVIASALGLRLVIAGSAVLLAAVLVLHGTSLILRETATALAIQQRLLPGYIAGLIVAMAAYLVLIPRLGGVGAAPALLIAETVVVISIAAAIWAEQQGWGFVLRGALGGGVHLCLLLGTGAVSLPVLLRLGRDMLARKAG